MNNSRVGRSQDQRRLLDKRSSAASGSGRCGRTVKLLSAFITIEGIQVHRHFSLQIGQGSHSVHELLNAWDRWGVTESALDCSAASECWAESAGTV